MLQRSGSEKSQRTVIHLVQPVDGGVARVVTDLVREVLTAAGLIRSSSPHLVHAHSAKAGLAARLAVRGRVPTVFRPHAWSFDAMEGHAAERALKWERYATRWTTRTLCVSETERRAGEQAGIAARRAVRAADLPDAVSPPALATTEDVSRARTAARHPCATRPPRRRLRGVRARPGHHPSTERASR
ncbi:glycosyltransferase [Streptomyces sp. NPDC060064]|uniref:glycosyltransferase n=1 Tax=Streptomyces sp. NPDC060064 TaxID=3347049 RepID=UPI0036A836C3